MRNSLFAAALLTAAGKPAGFGGTLGWNFAGKHCPADLTTEDSVTVQRRLADLVAAIGSAAMATRRNDAAE